MAGTLPPASSSRVLRASALEGPPSSGRTPRIDPLIGQTIDGRYCVERCIGEGGMGIVYAGRHALIDKKVAIKVLRGEMVGDAELAGRFLQEARAASSVGNPHIVDVSDFGILPDGSTYFVMELLEGKGLGEVLAEAHGPLPVARVVAIMKQIARGLGAAHAAQIVHRDLKPDNVMLVMRGEERDFVKVLDFGIAKVGGGPRKMTLAGAVFGTPHYMSPEQATGGVVDHRTDVYALGVLAYEMASGAVPFDGPTPMAIVKRHLHEAPAPIQARAPYADVPPEVDAIVLRCLAKDPAQRYGTMTELVADLERLEHERDPGSLRAVGATTVPAPRRWARARLASVVAVLALGVAVLIAAAYRGTQLAVNAASAPVVLPPVQPSIAALPSVVPSAPPSAAVPASVDAGAARSIAAPSPSVAPRRRPAVGLDDVGDPFTRGR
jgi:serine/threonine-protein kinase